MKPIDATGRTPKEKMLEELSYYFTWAGQSRRIADEELPAFEKECEKTPLRDLLEKYKKVLGAVGHDIDRTKAGLLYVKEGRGEEYDPVEVEELIMTALDTPPLKLMRKYQRSFQSLAGKLRKETIGVSPASADPVKHRKHRRARRMQKVEVPMSISSGGIDLSKAYESWYRKKGRRLLMKAFLEDYTKTL